MDRTLFLSYLTLVLITASGCGHSAPVKSGAPTIGLADKTSICELVALGGRAEGRKVRLDAVYTTDRFESTSITDPKCPGIVVRARDADSVDPSMKEFDTAVLGSVEDHSVRVFAFDVSGTFEWTSGKKPHGILFIERVWAFKRIPYTQ